MNTTGSDTTATDTSPDLAQVPADDADNTPQQLTLLTVEIPLQFRLDERTRRSGLQHVAELRAQIARQAAARVDRPDRLLRPASRQIAA
jgi:hypothetical protein